MKSIQKITCFALLTFLCGGVVSAESRDPMTLNNLPMDSIIKYATDGDCNAAYLLAARLHDGNKVDKDEKNSHAWMDYAAHCGNKWAMDEMALFYLGQNNADSGMYWARKAADLQIGQSQTFIGLFMYDNAKNATDSTEAYMWAYLGMLNSGENSAEMLDSMNLWITPQMRATGFSMVSTYLIPRLKEAKNTADSSNLIRELSEVGWPEAMYLQGLATYNDAELVYKVFNVPEDSTKKEGLELIQKAAEAGYAPAQRELGRRYYTGTMISYKSNYDSAFYWLSKASEQGDAAAEMWLGYTYEYGLGTKKNPKEALRLFKLSAAQYYPEGIRALGYFYWSKDAPKKNPIRARALLTLAESFYIQVDIIPIGETARKMNEKEKAESEQLKKDLDDKERIKTIIASWVD